MNNLSVNGLFAKPTIGRSEYGRVKVALAPGKGFMDWLRLTANKHLTKRSPEGVDHIELMKHNKKDDCWVHLFGTVYDVTKYLDFHPGGIPELLRGAGRDATPLFNQYHAWVNYESFLKACVVGPFTGDLSKLPPPLPPTTSEDPFKLGVPSINNSSEDNYGSRIETQKSTVILRHDDWESLTDDNVVCSVTPQSVRTAISTNGAESTEEHSRLRVLVHPFWKPAMEFEFEPSSELNGQEFKVIVEKNRVKVEFPNVSVEHILNKERVKIQKRPGVSYHKTTICKKQRVNHDTWLFKLKFDERMRYRIPLGHHVSVKVRKGNATLYRPYTPIRCSDPAYMELMIKIYQDGICTPSLEKLEVSGVLEISDPIGNQNFDDWICNSSQLILLAAGSGLTPMINILERRIQKSRSENSVVILMFNKTEKDIQTGEDATWQLSEWAREYEGHETVVLKNVLSSPENDSLTSSWLTGRVSESLLTQVLPKCTGSRRAFICGPDGFNMAAKLSLEQIGLFSDDVHVFQG